MENRYKGILQTLNRDKRALSPGDTTLQMELGYYFQRFWKPEMKVLEIGCGEGDSAEPLLRLTEAEIDLLDSSSGMIEAAKRKLEGYSDRVKFIEYDALEYLNSCEQYDCIYSALVIHNFKQPDKKAIVSEIYKKLKPGGLFLLMDKIYPDGKVNEYYESQCRRFQLLPENVRDSMLEHMTTDIQPDYVTVETEFMKELSNTGFRGIELLDRVEAEVLISAKR